MENMYFCMDMQKVPCHEQVLLRWVRQAEAALWEEEPALPVSRGARSRLSALLFQRLEAVAAPALNALLQERLSRSNPIATLNVGLVPFSEREAASAALLDYQNRTFSPKDQDKLMDQRFELFEDALSL